MRPTRLLRIEKSQSCDESAESYIHLDDGVAPCVYISLSHCWGNSQPLRLTKSTEAALRAGISNRELPRTFRDAVAVCQQLDVSYIWIDSLCIRQDDPQDWAVEAAAMRSVYTNALCNLAATGASDSSIGFHFKKSPIAHLPFRVPSKSFECLDWAFPPDWTSAVISEGPLNRRAWVLQERLLSSRIIHFTRAGVYWECLTHAYSETSQYALRLKQPEAALTLSFFKRTLEYAQQYHRLLSDPTISHLEDSKLQDMQNLLRVAKDTVQSLWIKQLAFYTNCGITKDTDKLVALEGLSQWFRHDLGIKMIYGMLDHRLIRELVWEVRTWPPTRKDPPLLPFWRAPTWSWASANYRITDTQYFEDHSDCKNLTDIAEIVTLDTHTVLSDSREFAALTLRGRILEVRLSMDTFEYWVESETILETTNGQVRIDSRHIVFDRLPALPFDGELTLVVLMECHCLEGGRSHGDMAVAIAPRSSLVALMLRLRSTTPKTYDRVGILRLEGFATNESRCKERACEWYHRNERSDVQEIVIV
jgi:hypothetical protein